MSTLAVLPSAEQESQWELWRSIYHLNPTYGALFLKHPGTADKYDYIFVIDDHIQDRWDSSVPSNDVKKLLGPMERFYFGEILEKSKEAFRENPEKWHVEVIRFLQKHPGNYHNIV
jgi:hypothetical protein